MAISYVPPKVAPLNGTITITQQPPTSIGANPIMLHADGLFEEIRFDAAAAFNLVMNVPPHSNPTIAQALAHSNESLSSNHDPETVAVRRYRVRFKRRYYGIEYYSEIEETFVEVEAEDEDEAEELALAEANEADWEYIDGSRHYGDSERTDTDDAEVDAVEELT